MDGSPDDECPGFCLPGTVSLLWGPQVRRGHAQSLLSHVFPSREARIHDLFDGSRSNGPETRDAAQESRSKPVS